jgi:hypothetical protein
MFRPTIIPAHHTPSTSSPMSASCRSFFQTGSMTDQSRSPTHNRSDMRRHLGWPGGILGRSDPIRVATVMEYGRGHPMIRLENMEIRITSQDNPISPGDSQLVEIWYGWTGTTWLGSLTVRLQPGSDVVALSSQSQPAN